LPDLKSLKLNFFGYLIEENIILSDEFSCSKTLTPWMMALEKDLKHLTSLKLLKPSQKIF